MPEDDCILLGKAIKHIEDPVQSAVEPALLHVGAHVEAVDFRGLGNPAQALGGVLFDMLGCAGVDEVQFEIGWDWCGRADGCGGVGVCNIR